MNIFYFETEDGKPFIPVGLNLCFQRFLTEEEEVFAAYSRQIKTFAENGGNYIRVWLGDKFFEMEPEREGEFDPVKIARIQKLLSIAEEHGVRIKFNIEHFRRMNVAQDKELDVLADAVKDSSALMAIELWNEINAVDADEPEWRNWTEFMLPEVQKRQW